MRVALVSGPDPGHLFPVAALACALRDRGAEVVVATGTQWRADLEHEELGFVELPLLAPTPDDADVGFVLWERPAQMAPPLADLLRDHRPDVVVSDTLTRAGAWAAELLGRPWIETSPHFLYDPDPAVPPIGLGAAPPRTAIGRTNQRSIRRRQAASVAAGRRRGRAARSRIGLQGDDRPIARLLATLPVLEPRRSTWPDGTYVVGPMVWEPPTWPELQVPAGPGAAVLVSDSTASGELPSIAEIARAWLARDASTRAVVTTSRPLVPIPGRVEVGRGGHTPLLSQVDVVVGTAGHGLVTKALAAGRPLVLVPVQGDQRETAARVERAGLGRVVAPHALSPRVLRRAVGAVSTDPAMRARASETATRVRRLGPGRAAAVVASVVDALR